MQTEEITHLLKKSALAGAERHLHKHALPRSINKAAAYRLYGRTNVDRWIVESLIQPKGKLLDRELLAKIADASNRITYLPVRER
jgi:hypothetical protein